MKNLIEFAISILAGLGLHQTSSITHKMPEGWEQLAGTAIGVEGTLPVFVFFLKKLKVPNDIIFLVVVAYQVAYLLVGVGVALGWLLDLLFHIDREK